MHEKRAAAQKVSNATLAQAFQPETTIFLRTSGLGGDQMYPVSCISLHEASRVVVVQISPEQQTSIKTPKVGAEVSLNSIRLGVLYVAKATVLEQSVGKTPRVRIKTERQVAAIKLRQHPRFVTVGKVNLGVPGGSMSIRVHLEFNISQGGFGFSLPTGNWTGHDVVAFELDTSQATVDVKSSKGLGLQLVGRGEIRKRGELPGKPGEEYFGIMFTELGTNQASQLEMWLASVSTELRQL